MTARSWIAIAAILVLLAAAGAASARVSGTVFYLSVHTRQCLTKYPAVGVKTVEVVPCSDPSHTLEVFAVGHGGWPGGPPSNASTIAKRVCIAAYHGITHHPMPRTYAWEGFWPDAGAETAKYGDKIICSLRTWPGYHALGAGWHVR